MIFELALNSYDIYGNIRKYTKNETALSGKSVVRGVLDAYLYRENGF